MSTNIRSTMRPSLMAPSGDHVTFSVRLDRPQTKTSLQLPGGWQEPTNSYSQAPEKTAPSLWGRLLGHLVGQPKAEETLDQTCRTGPAGGTRRKPSVPLAPSRRAASSRPVASSKAYHADLHTSPLSDQPSICQSPIAMPDFHTNFDLPPHHPELENTILPNKRPTNERIDAPHIPTPPKSKKSSTREKAAKGAETNPGFRKTKGPAGEPKKLSCDTLTSPILFPSPAPRHGLRIKTSFQTPPKIPNDKTSQEPLRSALDGTDCRIRAPEPAVRSAVEQNGHTKVVNSALKLLRIPSGAETLVQACDTGIANNTQHVSLASSTHALPSRNSPSLPSINTTSSRYSTPSNIQPHIIMDPNASPTPRRRQAVGHPALQKQCDVHLLMSPEGEDPQPISAAPVNTTKKPRRSTGKGIACTAISASTNAPCLLLVSQAMFKALYSSEGAKPLCHRHRSKVVDDEPIEPRVPCIGNSNGRPCKNSITALSRPAWLLDDEPIPYLCPKHERSLLAETGFRSAETDQWVDYAKWIVDDPNLETKVLSNNTKALLRERMKRGPSEKEEDGYVYCYEILQGEDSDYLHLKVGRSRNYVNRLAQWKKKCGTDNVLKGWFPGLPEGTRLTGVALEKILVERGMAKKGRNSHMLERLIHLNLKDLAESYELEPCRCGTLHKEIFTFNVKDIDGGDLWEYVLRPVFERWTKYIDECT